MDPGVSIVVCCHNSALRLPATLAHLAAQELTATVPWEVIVVDNASTDGTRDIAMAHWPVNPPAPLRVVSEPQPGVAYARLKGVLESRYELVSFVDDDNWVCSDWVSRCSQVMSSRPEVGACGGQVEAVCEVPPPCWFDVEKASFAIGAQGTEAGDVTEGRGYLWTAGMTLRKEAFLRILSGGFEFLMTGRKGGALTAGEDPELCCALRLAGWRLWYEPSLRMRHYLPAARLNWSYLKRLMRGFGASSVGLDCYFRLLRDEPTPVVGRLQGSWLWQAIVTSAKLSVLVGCHPGALIRRSEGCPVTLRVEWHVGRLRELVAQRKRYRQAIQRVRGVAWH